MRRHYFVFMLAGLLVGACGKSVNLGEGLGMQSKLQIFEYSYQGENYRFSYFRDHIAKAWKVVSLTREGSPLSSDNTDDDLVQKVMRAVFTQKFCNIKKQTPYAGLAGGGGYGPYGEKGQWGGILKCTAKLQSVD